MLLNHIHLGVFHNRLVCCRLHKTQELLYDSTKDFLQQRYDHRNKERVWIHDKDRLLLDLDQCRSQLNLTSDDVLRLSVTDTAENLTEEVEVRPSSQTISPGVGQVLNRLRSLGTLRSMEYMAYLFRYCEVLCVLVPGLKYLVQGKAVLVEPFSFFLISRA